jgi:hypothetical protein
MAVNNVTGGFAAVVLLLVLLIRRPLLALMVPVSLIVLWDYGSTGLALLWAALLVVAHRREGREAARLGSR